MNTNLYGWLFTFNCYENMWYAFKGEDLNDYWNGNPNSNILKNEDKNVLIKAINTDSVIVNPKELGKNSGAKLDFGKL